MEVGRLVLDVPLLAVVVVAAWTDVRDGKVYNWLTYPAALAGLCLNAALRPPGLGLSQAALGLLVGFVPLFLAYAAGGLGGGDVKLTAAVGAFLGPWAMLYALLYSFLAGALCCLLLIVAREGLAGLGARVLRLRTVEGGEGRPGLRFPFAVAVLVGVVWVLVEQHLGSSLLDALRPSGA